MVRSNFNLLLLDEGEYLLEENNVVAFVWGPSEGGAAAPELLSTIRGRLRICTRGIFLEPDDTRLPVVKYPFRTMPGRPQQIAVLQKNASSLAFAQAAKNENLNARESFAFQPQQVIEFKAGGTIGPYKTRTVDSEIPAKSASTSSSSVSSTANQHHSSALSAAARVTSAFAAEGGLFGSKGSDSTVTSPAVAQQAGAHAQERSTVVIALLHSSAASTVALAQQLWDLQQSCLSSHSGRERSMIESVLSNRIDGTFDLSLLGDYRERTLLPASPRAIVADRIFPLVSCPGRFMVTEKAVYFQPVRVNNVAGSDPVQRWVLGRDVRRVQRRTRLQRQVGLELFFTAGDGLLDSGDESLRGNDSTSSGADVAAAGLNASHNATSSIFLSFLSPLIRDDVYKVILGALREQFRSKHSHTSSSSSSAHVSEGDVDDQFGDPSPAHVEAVTRAWQDRKVSNLQYLLFLNGLAGRTLSDITQYPVLPWVIADYSSTALNLHDPKSFRDLSKPIGALNESRIKSFRERYAEMPTEEGFDPPFIFGTHYSTPGYCLHFLVRTMPEHMLRLQTGRFDAPDRLFFDLAASWAGITSTNSDLKELIPEFFTSDGSFLLAPDGLDLGVRQNGKRVGDVQLPPWAYDSGDFIAQNRDALESDIVSASLHNWIDLIFGYKQRGEAAVEADNLFYYLTYEGAVDVEAETDPDKRASLQAQIAEFGQTPRQLFTQRHVSRNSAPESTIPIVSQLSTSTVLSTEHQLTAQSDSTEKELSAKENISVPLYESSSWSSVNVQFTNGKYSTRSAPTGMVLDFVSIGVANQLISDITIASTDGKITTCGITLESNDNANASLQVQIQNSLTPCILKGPESHTRLVLLDAALNFDTGSDAISIVTLCVSPDSKIIFAASLNATIYAINRETNKVIGELALSSSSNSRISQSNTGNPDLRPPILSLAAFNNGSRAGGRLVDYILAVGGWDSVVAFWGVSLNKNEETVLQFENSPLLVIDCSSEQGPALPVTHIDIANQTLALRPSSSNPSPVMMAVGDSSGRLSLISLRSQNRKLSDSSPEYHVKTIASSDALLVEHTGRGDLLAGGVSGIVHCRAFARNGGPAGSTVIAASSDGRICFFIAALDLLSLWPASVLCTGEVIRCMALAGDGLDAVIAVSGNSGIVRVWDASCDVLRSSVRERSDALLAMAEQMNDAQIKPSLPQMFHSTELSSASLSVPTNETETLSTNPHSHWITSLVVLRPPESNHSSLALLGLTRKGEVVAWVAKASL